VVFGTVGGFAGQGIKTNGKDEGEGEDRLHRFKRAPVEVAEMSERFERFKRVKEDVGKEWKDIWYDCNPTWALNPQGTMETGESIFDELPEDNSWTGV
jgi:hypothetical protein